MSSRCTICGDRAKRDLVDAALLAGERPSDVLKRYPDIASASSLYRHCRDHKPSNVLTVAWLDGETTSGEVLADLAGLRRNLFAQYGEQRQRGDSAGSTRSAHEAHAVSATLLKSGITDEEQVVIRRYAERLTRAVQRATRSRPEFARELGAAAVALGDDELADDAAALAVSDEKFNRTIQNS